MVRESPVTGVRPDAATNRIGTLTVQVAGPALTMLVTGSIAWFLIEVFYSGPLVGRCKWIFGLFSFAAVLTSRISIEEGRERAAIYGFGLAFATLMVASQFMGGNPVGLAALLAFVWWCAGRLTWDCTFIDKSRDATGQGMIDLAIDRVTRYREVRRNAREGDVDDRQRTDNSDPAEVQAKKDRTTGWETIKGLFLARRQPNTPGLWAFYFLLGGLPFFGLGQLFMPVRDDAAHSAVAGYFFIYTSSLLGLLMLSSINGLHRYLARHEAVVPGRVAHRWILVGGLLAIGVTGAAWILPRPVPEYSLGRLIPHFFSPGLESSSVSFGRDGQQSDEGGGNQNIDSGPQSRDERGDNDDEADGQGGNQRAGESGPKVDSQGGKESGGKSSGGKEGGGKTSDSKSSEGGGGKKSSGDSSKDSQKGDSKNSSGKKGEPSPADKKGEGQGDKKDDSSGDKKRQGEGKSEPADMKPDEGKSGDSPDEKSDAKKSDEPGKRDSGNVKKSEPRDRNAAGNRSSSGRSGAKPREKTQRSNWFSGVGQLIRWLFWLAAILAILWYSVRYRDRIGPWIRSFLAEMADFWNRLFNRRREKAREGPAIQSGDKHAGPTHPGFASFQNPFASGTADRWPAGQTIEYTFRALEAWAGEQKIGRHPDQTAIEFARAIGRKFPSMATETASLASLYSQLAYDRSGTGIARSATSVLAKLWEKLAATHGQPAYRSAGAKITAPSGGRMNSTL